MVKSTKITLLCDNCDNEFKIRPGKANRFDNHYCSKECARIDKKARAKALKNAFR